MFRTLNNASTNFSFHNRNNRASELSYVFNAYGLELINFALLPIEKRFVQGSRGCDGLRHIMGGLNIFYPGKDFQITAT
jgi:hypothetical protein